MIVKGDDRGDPALTKRICGFDSRLLLDPVIPKTFKNGSGLFLHGTHDEGGTTKHNWSARCQYNLAPHIIESITQDLKKSKLVLD